MYFAELELEPASYILLQSGPSRKISLLVDSKLVVDLFHPPNMRPWRKLKRVSSLIKLTEVDHHAAIEDIVANARPSWGSFPWERLQQYTDEHLTKLGQRKGRKSAGFEEERDILLTEFIFAHVRKEVAVAAVGHVLSASTIAQLLPALKAGTFVALESESFQNYLETILALRHCQPNIITEKDAILAKSFLSFAHASSPSARRPKTLLCLLTETLCKGVPISSLLAEHISKFFLREVGVRRTKLNDAHERGRYFQAYQLCTWLPDIQSCPVRPEMLDVCRLMDQHFQHWRAWASWKPDYTVIGALQRPLDQETLRSLRELIALEGPSFDDASKSIERERVMTMPLNQTLLYHRMVFPVAGKDMRHISHVLDILRMVLLVIVHTNTKERQELVENICCKEAVTDSRLRLLAECFGIPRNRPGLSELFHAINEVLACQKTPAMQTSIKTVKTLLQAFAQGAGPELQSQLGPLVIKAAAVHFNQMQQQLYMVSKIAAADKRFLDAIEELDTLARSISSAKLLHRQAEYNAFGPSLLRNWPDLEEIRFYKSVFNESLNIMQDNGTHITREIVRHVAARLVAPTGIDKGLPSWTFDRIAPAWSESLSTLWKETETFGPNQRTYRAIGIFLAESASHLDNTLELKLICIEQLRFVDHDFARWLSLFFDPRNVDDLRLRFIDFAVQLATYCTRSSAHPCSTLR